MMNNKKFTLLAVLALMLATGLWLTGCESDTVAPHEGTPALSADDVAHQAGALASAAARVMPQLVEFTPAGGKNEYSYDFASQEAVSGIVYFDFRTGGADGAPAAYDVGDWGRMYTMSDAPVVFEVGIGGEIELSFDVFADLVQATNTATLLEGSSGTFVAGDYTATFSFANVVVTAGDDYPSGGTMTFVSGGRTMTVTFDGDNMVTITLTDEGSWTVNLDDGTVTEL